MKRQRVFDELERPPERQRLRQARLQSRASEDADDAAAAELHPADLPEALLLIGHRFGLEAWASARDDRGLWAFGQALAQWLDRSSSDQQTPVEVRVEAVRLVTNLLVILGAVTRPLPQVPAAGYQHAETAVAAARHDIAARHGPAPSFPGAARAMQRLVRVRGWARLPPPQQGLAEAMLGLYLESLAATVTTPGPSALLALSEAWLTVLNTQALPTGFDERMLRAISWYLETYLTSGAVR